MKAITLVWADGTQEKVYCRYWRVTDGQLTIEINRDEWRYIPVASLREWREG